MKFNNIFKLGMTAIWIFMLLNAIYLLFHMPLVTVTTSIIIGTLIFLYIKFKNVPPFVSFLLAIMVFLDIFFGSTLNFYYKNFYFDKFLHLVGSIVLCIFFYYLLKDKIKDKKLLILFSVLASITLSTFWEIIEYVSDIIFNGTLQGVYSGRNINNVFMSKIDDTMIDIILNFAGAIIFMLVFYFNKIIKKKK